MSELNDIDQITFSTGYLGLNDSQDSTYATKGGYVVTVSQDETGTILLPPVILPDLSTYLKASVAATAYATNTSVTAISTALAAVLALPAPTLDSVLSSGSSSAKGATVGSLTAGSTTRTSANHTFSSTNVVGTGASKFQIVNIGTSNQMSFFAETYGFSAVGYNIDLTANQATYAAHETGFSSFNRFDKSTGTHTIYTAPSITAGSTCVPVQAYQLDSSGNATFSGGITATNGNFSGAISASTCSFQGGISASSGTFSSLGVANTLHAYNVNCDSTVTAGILKIGTGGYAFQDSDSYVNLVLGINTQSGVVGTIPKRQIILGAAGSTPPNTGVFRAGDIYIAG